MTKISKDTPKLDDADDEVNDERRAVLAKFGKVAVTAPAMIALLTARSSEAWAGSGTGDGGNSGSGSGGGNWRVALRRILKKLFS